LHKVPLNDEYLQYTAIFSSSKPPAKNGYAGTAMYIRKDALPVGARAAFDLQEKADLEAVWQHEGRSITIEFAAFIAVNLYVPNAGVPDLKNLDVRLKQWDVQLREYVRRLEEKKPVIVCGDMNCAHLDGDIWHVGTKDKRDLRKLAGLTPQDPAPTSF